MRHLIIYPDIKARAIKNPSEEDYLRYENTDHGLLDDDTFNELTKRRIQELFKTQSYVEQVGNEIWRVKPDGSREFIKRIVKYGECS
ncbi:hypothetical protein [Gilliamella sp. Occ3-1]|uniref:hypothetical protein n=1 Tax=unclassified Gilliamella TaxID=2685620 RepID=UPI00080DFCF6|nr:hypothetical protein [Gilliamella apicola]OCG70850.1 hypothetical protein A9G43_06790 [Gilliamella apicola]